MSTRDQDGRKRRRRLGVLALGTLCAVPACSSQPSEKAAVPSSAGQPPTAGAGAPPVANATPMASDSMPGSGARAGESVNADVPVAMPMPAQPAAVTPATADAGTGLDVAAPACARDVTEANKAVVRSAIDELFVQGDITAVDRYWGEPYLQHNPIATSGVATFRNLFGGLISPGNSIYDLARVVGQCELVVIHGDYTSFGGPTFDMFRVEQGRLVEHWDAFAVSEGPNASGRTALDGDAVVRDTALTAQNEALVIQFVESVLEGQSFDAIGDYMSPDLIEHSPESADGSAAFVQSLQNRAITYREIHHSIADGNFVFVLSEGSVGDTDVALYDLFRVEASRIVEHWDGRREVPATTQSGLGIF
jgi:predicted SnoaL-like aldol condensation-catalyzing enzyme